MKRIIRLSEEQLRNIVSNVIKEQSTPMGVPTPQKSPNIGCIGLKSMEPKKQITGINGEIYVFYSNGRFADVKGNKGNYECGSQANIVNLMFDTDPKAVKYFNMTPPAANSNINCAPQLVDTSKGKTLKFGCKTQGVKELQTLLNFPTPTGYFGTVTKQKVVDFQKSNSLNPDGIVGPKTYAALIQSVNTKKVDTTGSGIGNNSNNQQDVES